MSSRRVDGILGHLAARNRTARIGVVLCVALSLGFGLVYYPRALSTLGDRATANSELSFAYREIAGGNSVVVDQEAAYEARALIPRDTTYRVVTGSRLRGATDLTGSFVSGWFAYFLLPRRPAPDARWVVCYGCDPRGLDVRWRDDAGISIGRVR